MSDLSEIEILRAKLEQCEKAKDGYAKQLDALCAAVTDALVKRIEPRLSRHPVTVVQYAGSVIERIGREMGSEFEDGEDLVECVRLLVRECAAVGSCTGPHGAHPADSGGAMKPDLDTMTDIDLLLYLRDQFSEDTLAIEEFGDGYRMSVHAPGHEHYINEEYSIGATYREAMLDLVRKFGCMMKRERKQ